MRITKLEHAALLVEDDGRSLLIDPGSFSATLPDVARLDAIVITHEHADHWTPDHLDRLAAAAPDAPVLGPEGVARATGRPVRVVRPGEEVSVGAFSLSFFGGRHEIIHSSLPVVDNVGVLVNDSLYYPGDSYALPGDAPIAVLAAPTGAPWLRLGDAMDFVLAAHAATVLPSHDCTLSAAGRAMHVARLAWAAEQAGGRLVDLSPGDALDA